MDGLSQRVGGWMRSIHPRREAGPFLIAANARPHTAQVTTFGRVRPQPQSLARLAPVETAGVRLAETREAAASRRKYGLGHVGLGFRGVTVREPAPGWSEAARP